MRKVTRIIGLFFASVLFFFSISIENYSFLLATQLQNSQSENSDTYYSPEKPILFFLNLQEQRLVYSVKNLPVPSLKSHPGDFHWNCLFPKAKISCINSGYLSYSLTLYRSLTNNVIIFPFHYFW
jgi:hypothetical protein